MLPEVYNATGVGYNCIPISMWAKSIVFNCKPVHELCGPTRRELRSGGAFLERFVPRALFKMDIISVLLGGNGYGRNGYWPKWFLAENVQMTTNAFIFNYAPVLARVLT